LRKKKAAPIQRLRAPHVLHITAMRNAATTAGNLDSPVIAHSDKDNVPVKVLARNLKNELCVINVVMLVKTLPQNPHTLTQCYKILKTNKFMCIA
jgi:hypothetical protein